MVRHPGGIHLLKPTPGKGPLAIFDLDDTLIDGDSDRLWGSFLAARGYGPPSLVAEHARYHQLYCEGRLDIRTFLEFQLGTLAGLPMEQLKRWREEYIAEYIRPRLLPAAAALVERHRAQGHYLVVITATNHFLTKPIAALYGISALLATDLEIVGGRYTGRTAGLPCFAEGKVQRILDWLNGQTEMLASAWFYSDSQNDLPLLRKAGHPVAVDPDPVLRVTAEQQGWPIISLRGTALKTLSTGAPSPA